MEFSPNETQRELAALTRTLLDRAVHAGAAG